jgi:hypothetical protein
MSMAIGALPALSVQLAARVASTDRHFMSACKKIIHNFIICVPKPFQVRYRTDGALPFFTLELYVKKSMHIKNSGAATNL